MKKQARAKGSEKFEKILAETDAVAAGVVKKKEAGQDWTRRKQGNKSR